MYLSDEPLYISTEVVDKLFTHTLRGSVAQAAPSSDVWNHIEQAVQHLPAQGDFAVSHLPQASYVPHTEMQPRL